MNKNRKNKITSFFLATLMVVLNALGLSGCHKNENKNNDEIKEPDKVIEQVEHNHVYQIKKSIDIYTEKQICECGKSIIDDHSYNVITEYIPNCDNNHIVHRTFICENCHNTFNTVMTEQCNYPDSIDNDKRTCLKCGYVDIKDHIHNWQSLNKIDNVYEYYSCSKCSAVKPFYHNLMIKEVDDNIKYVECQNEHCNYSHIDSYQEYDYYECSCGEKLAIKKDLEPNNNYTNNYYLVRKKK